MVEVTQDEIQAVARALAGPRADDMTRAGYPVWMIYQLGAQAAIAALDAARGKAEPSLWPGLDHIANYINSLDTEGMSGLEVRKAIYRQCIQLGKPTRGDRVAQVVEWLRKENGLCDCHARCETECGCGAWDDWKTKPLLEIADAIERGEPFNG